MTEDPTHSMEEAIRKAAALIEAMPYIRAFRDKIFVIKFGGAAMEDSAALACVLDDVVFLETVGIRPILVHGGGPAISREMKRRRIEPRFVHGHRVTDEATMGIVRDVLANRINADICRTLERMSGRAVPFVDPSRGALRARLAPLARGPDGETLNVNADMVAASVASGLRAEKVVFLSDMHGILTDPDDPASFASTLTAARIAELIRTGIIAGGMLPKVEACRTAIGAGVRKAHIIDGRIRHSLLLEIFTDEGVGTQIVQ